MRCSIDRTDIRSVPKEKRVDNTLSTRVHHEFRAVADQTTSRNLELKVSRTSLDAHILHISFAASHLFNNRSAHTFRTFKRNFFERLRLLAALFLHNNLRTRNLELKSFTAHALDQNREVK